MEHQDWDPVTFYKPKVETKTVPKGTHNSESQRLRKLENDDEMKTKVKVTTMEQRQTIIKGRTEKKMTQKNLASHLNINVKNIQGYENGKSPIVMGELNKIQRFIGYKLSGNNIGDKI